MFDKIQMILMMKTSNSNNHLSQLNYALKSALLPHPHTINQRPDETRCN